MKTRLRKSGCFAVAAVFAAFWSASMPVRAAESVSVSGNQIIVAGEQEFEAGFVLIPRIPVFWQSDGPWRLMLSAADANLGTSSDASYVKPIADLSWRLSSTQAWMPLTQDMEEVDSSSKNGSGVVYIDLIVHLNWLKDAPGDYNVNLIFTIEPL